MDYSKTVNLPETDFPMKANLPEKEPKILAKWEKENIYKKILGARTSAEKYILHDGPPYANGHIHIGHSLNKVLKDIIVKHKSMMGFFAPYVPGWDCHGLPIELNVSKELGDKAASMSKSDIRSRCRVFADKFVSIQMEEFKRLGVFGDYENPYKTMTKDYEATIVEVFGGLLKEGYIYKSKKPIYWCPTCVTALAEAEVEYANHTSSSIFVKFKVDPKSVKTPGIDADKLFVVIWTTTPWTLPANLAVCFHPDFQYSAYQIDNEFYIIAKGLVEKFVEINGKKVTKEISLKIADIESLHVHHPFIDRESKVIFGDHVTLDQGTGVVHTAPGHGHEDYVVGLKYGLEAYCPVDDQGKFTDDFPQMKGVHVFKANPLVIDVLKEKNALISTSELEHSYPHCWRCKKPLIYRATEQWFFQIDHKDLRKKAIKAVDETQWIPSWGESRFRSMVETRPDWCLSRQRSWGVPIPSFKCVKCNKINMTAESVMFFAEIARTKSIDEWFSDDIKNLIPPDTKCSCGSSEFIKEFDILDVWFDSGVSHFAVLDSRPDHKWPADMYLEGSDQHRGWFQSSIWPALALKGHAPFKTVLTHGFVLDDQGKAMSKSVGNVIPPEKIIKQFGADILRLWVSSEDYRNDLRIGMDMMNQVADSYRKIRNTFKFIIGNLGDFKENDSVPYEKLSDLDRWVLHNLYLLYESVISHYEKFEFHLVYRKILNFCAVDLSSIYFDVSKDILYVDIKNSQTRRSTQTVLNETYKVLLTLIAPVLPFTAEEIWGFNKNSGSIHEQKYYQPDKKFFSKDVETNFGGIVNAKQDLLKAVEILRRDKVIRASLEVEASICPKKPELKKSLIEMGDELKRFFQIADVSITEKTDDMVEYDTVFLKVSKADGKKCVRCWNFTKKIGTDAEHPELCPRCTKIIKELQI